MPPEPAVAFGGVGDVVSEGEGEVAQAAEAKGLAEPGDVELEERTTRASWVKRSPDG